MTDISWYVLQYVLYVTHWSACMFYFIATQYGLDQDTWIGRHFDDVVDMPLAVRWTATSGGFGACMRTWQSPKKCQFAIFGSGSLARSMQIEGSVSGQPPPRTNALPLHASDVR